MWGRTTARCALGEVAVSPSVRAELAVSEFARSTAATAGAGSDKLLAMSEVVFSPGDLAALTEVVADAWRLGADRDWSVPAGTLEWSCTHTADHQSHRGWDLVRLNQLRSRDCSRLTVCGKSSSAWMATE